jgi:hypothetical protein
MGFYQDEAKSTLPEEGVDAMARSVKNSVMRAGSGKFGLHEARPQRSSGGMEPKGGVI